MRMLAGEQVEREVLAALQRLNAFVSGKDMAFLSEFAPTADIRLVGSEGHEIAEGPEQIRAFLKKLFALPITISWDWQTRAVSSSGSIAWVFASGEAVISSGNDEKRLPYRMTGVLERHGDRWLWRLFHGSEPA
jgi:hypothetical protein